MMEQEGRIGSIELIKEMIGIVGDKIVTAKVLRDSAIPERRVKGEE